MAPVPDADAALAALKAVASDGIEFSYKYLAATLFFFNFTKTYAFGRVIRAVQFPDGNLLTIKTRAPTMGALKRTLLAAQPPIFPGVVTLPSEIHLAKFTAPHFTEPLTKVSQLQDGDFVLWAREGVEIPERGVSLTGKVRSQEDDVDDAIRFVYGHTSLPMDKRNLFLGLLIDRDPGMLAIYRNFGNDDDADEFVTLVDEYIVRNGITEHHLGEEYVPDPEKAPGTGPRQFEDRIAMDHHSE